MSSVIWSQGDLIASTIRITPPAVRPRPQWFSRPRTTPQASARGRSFSIDEIAQPNACSSVWPSIGGSIPFLAMKSSNDLTVPHRPVLIRIVGIPRLAASSIWYIVFWTLVRRRSASG